MAKKNYGGMVTVNSRAIFNVPPRAIFEALATQDGWLRLGLGKPAIFVRRK